MGETWYRPKIVCMCVGSRRNGCAAVKDPPAGEADGSLEAHHLPWGSGKAVCLALRSGQLLLQGGAHGAGERAQPHLHAVADSHRCGQLHCLTLNCAHGGHLRLVCAEAHLQEPWG